MYICFFAPSAMVTKGGQVNKVVLLGNATVGKTSIISTFMRKEYREDSAPTVAGTYRLHAEVIDGVKIALQIWDTAGEERFRSLNGIYVQNARACLLVFAQDDRASFASLDDWLAFLRDELKESPCAIILVCNKIDRLRNGEVSRDQTVALQEAEEFADARGLRLIPVSAKDGDGLDAIFHQVAQDLRSALPDDTTSEAQARSRRCCC